MKSKVIRWRGVDNSGRSLFAKGEGLELIYKKGTIVKAPKGTVGIFVCTSEEAAKRASGRYCNNVIKVRCMYPRKRPKNTFNPFDEATTLQSVARHKKHLFKDFKDTWGHAKDICMRFFGKPYDTVEFYGQVEVLT